MSVGGSSADSGAERSVQRAVANLAFTPTMWPQQSKQWYNHPDQSNTQKQPSGNHCSVNDNTLHFRFYPTTALCCSLLTMNHSFKKKALRFKVSFKTSSWIYHFLIFQQIQHCWRHSDLSDICCLTLIINVFSTFFLIYFLMYFMLSSN